MAPQAGSLIPMTRRLGSLVLAVASIILSVRVLPFDEFIIEPHADGSNLGVMPVSDVRIVSISLGIVSLEILALLIAASRRFRLGVTPWTAALASFAFGFAIVVCVFLER